MLKDLDALENESEAIRVQMRRSFNENFGRSSGTAPTRRRTRLP